MNDDVIDGEYVAGSVQAAPLALRVDEPIRALVSPEEARKQWDDYQALKAAIADADDFQPIVDKKTNKTKRFPKKSFVKKVQTYFGVTVKIRDKSRDDLGDGHFAWAVTAAAIAPNGREVEATGGCSTFEDRFDVQPFDNETDEKYQYRRRKANARAYHDVLSTAETRATNRAVMNLIGGGEVTAEEVSRNQTRPAPRAENAPPAKDELTRARETVMAFCTKHKIDDTTRYSITQSLFAQESTKGLTVQQLRELYAALIAHVKEQKNA